MRRSGPNSQPIGGRKNAAAIAAAQNKFRKLRIKLNPSARDGSSSNMGGGGGSSVGKTFQNTNNAPPLPPPPKPHHSRPSTKNDDNNLQIRRNSPKAKKLIPSRGGFHGSQAEDISTADLFNAIVNAPAPGPMWNEIDVAGAGPDVNGGDGVEDETETDDYPSYEGEVLQAEVIRKEEERRRYLNGVKLASDLEDEKEREEEVRHGRRTNKGVATAWIVANSTAQIPGVNKGNRNRKLGVFAREKIGKLGNSET